MTEVLIPDASNWINALEAGKKSGMADQTNRAQRAAGGLMASGDYKGAAAALYSTGDLATGSAVATAGAKQEAQNLTLSRAAKVSEKLHAGDYAGAYAEAGTDKELLDGLDKVSAHARETNGILASSLQGLKGLQYADAKQKYDTQIKPALLARKIFAPEQLDAFDPTPENITAMESQVLGLEKSLDLAKPDYHEVKNADTSTRFVDLNPRNAQPGQPAGAQGQPTAEAAPVAEAPIPTGGMYATIGQIASTKGAKPEEVGYLQRLAHVESHGDPSAQNGSSTGLFQFHPDTFAGAGGGNIHDAGDQTAAALNLSRRDRANLQDLGIEPTDANVYIMHQQGAGGGRALLTAPPEVGAVAVLTPVYGSAKTAERAIVGNGGTADMTAGDFVGMWRARWANGGKPVPAGQPAAAPQVQPQGGPPSIAGSEKQPQEWTSDGKIMTNRRTGERKADPTSVTDEDTPLGKDTILLLAGKYLNNGSLPPMGAGKTGTRNRTLILNEATKMASDLGLDANDLVAGTASVKAAGTALGQITKTIAANAGFEQTAVKNGDLMLSLAPKGGGQTNMPVLNRWLQAGRKHVAGDPDVTAFDNALGAFSEEYAKVMTGSLGNAAATEGARHDAADRLGKYATGGQLAAGLGVMKQEMENRTSSLREVETGLRNTIHNGGQPGGLGGQPASAPHADAPKTKRLEGASEAQNAAIAKMTSFSGKPGDKTNPLVPRNEKEYEGVKPGAWYLHPAGDLRQKGG